VRVPKLTQVFLERTDLDSAEFKRWFKNSKVVDSQGRPAVMYHGTSAPGNFDVFMKYGDIGHHFGTPRAASDRIMRKHNSTHTPRGGRIYPVYLSIQTPLETDDWMTWEPDKIVQWMETKGIISPDERESVAARSGKQKQAEVLRKLLKQHGYDGLRYANSTEGGGDDSWVALDPTQIKSVHNRGTWDPRRGSIME
jgi:hypothetical protein